MRKKYSQRTDANAGRHDVHSKSQHFTCTPRAHTWPPTCMIFSWLKPPGYSFRMSSVLP